MNQLNYNIKTFQKYSKGQILLKYLPVDFIFNDLSSTLSIRIVAHAENLQKMFFFNI